MNYIIKRRKLSTISTMLSELMKSNGILRFLFVLHDIDHDIDHSFCLFSMTSIMTSTMVFVCSPWHRPWFLFVLYDIDHDIDHGFCLFSMTSTMVFVCSSWHRPWFLFVLHDIDHDFKVLLEKFIDHHVD